MSALASKTLSNNVVHTHSSKRVVRQSVQCQALPEHTSATAARRAVLLGALIPAVISVPKARALILDEEDEDLVEKAKANRKARLAEQRATTRQFLQDDGLKNIKLDQDLIPVQKAVNQLAKSGSQLEAGDVSGAASTLNGGWVSDFKQAAVKVSAASTEDVFSKLDALQGAANKGDLTATKKSFVQLVAAVGDWASSSGVAANLKGL